MLNADRAPYFLTCPRCGEGGLEQLATHSYCVNCNYFEVKDSGEILSIPDWVLAYLKATPVKTKIIRIKAKKSEPTAKTDDETIQPPFTKAGGL